MTISRRIAGEREALPLRFLQFYRDGPPDRCWWLQGRTRLTRATDLNPPAQATHLLVYRLGDGRRDIKGGALDRTTIRVGDLHALSGCWAVPLQRLNADGLALSGARPEKRLAVIGYRPTDGQLLQLKAVAASSGAHVSAILARAVDEFLDRQRLLTPFASSSGPAPAKPGPSRNEWSERPMSNPARGAPLLIPPCLVSPATLHFVDGKVSVTDGDGTPLAGARLWVRQPGTDEPKAAFTDDTYLTPVGLFVVADAQGEFPELHAREGEAFDLVLTDAAGDVLLRYSVTAIAYPWGQR